ncbi:uncharacterized protein BDZ99DRAFT_523069 [Mytilinidion resinicola]|uniref:Uncharacterized protein n=1 Tax=Mytilinidion resinicola TaxID=574789 RepID=A0A6A6YHG7_9PEZI|nr:uncharacterized protein BDZ99DRAFT_523069 [Mytilinidion resinicola]KAF2807455.1 hypothetical protein BDZ99DRAFT_523069 [Mytilinidion resinicola]
MGVCTAQGDRRRRCWTPAAATGAPCRRASCLAMGGAAHWPHVVAAPAVLGGCGQSSCARLPLPPLLLAPSVPAVARGPCEAARRSARSRRRGVEASARRCEGDGARPGACRAVSVDSSHVPMSRRLAITPIPSAPTPRRSPPQAPCTVHRERTQPPPAAIHRALAARAAGLARPGCSLQSWPSCCSAAAGSWASSGSSQPVCACLPLVPHRRLTAPSQPAVLWRAIGRDPGLAVQRRWPFQPGRVNVLQHALVPGSRFNKTGAPKHAAAR